MPSPFPGMNPYFEQPGVWRGFHGHLISQMAFALTPQANPRYFVSVEGRDYLDYDGDEPKADLPTVIRSPSDCGPVTARIPDPVRRQHRWLTICDAQSREVVTVVDLRCPPAAGGLSFRERRRIFRSATHLVEIDLLRGGPRIPVGGVRPSDYRVMVSRQPNRPNVEVWPVGLRDPLPAIPIPFRTGDAEPLIALKPLLDSVYDSGGYQYQLYHAPPDPPLLPDDAEWARQFVPPAG